MNKNLSLILILVLLGTTQVQAGSNSGADFLKIPKGARGLAMGQAYSAIADGSDALDWNAAGIMPRRDNLAPSESALSVSHQELFFGNNLDYLAVVIPQKETRIGFSLTRLSYPSQEARNLQGDQTGSFGANDLSLGMALASHINGFRLGTQLKFIRQQLANEEATGVALDLGILSPTPISRLQVGASIKNIGNSMHFINEQYALPLTLAVGAAYQISGPLVVSLDVRSLVKQKQTNVSIGTEFALNNTVVLRSGYLAQVASAISNSQKDETNRGSFGSLAGLNAGFGVKVMRFNLDYAISPFGELGNIHTFTFSTSFGGSNLDKNSRDEQNKTNSLDSDTKDTQRQIIIFDDSTHQKEWWK